MIFKKHLAFTASLFSLILFMGATVQAADEKPNFSDEKMTGDWNGIRSKLFDAGYNFDGFYAADAWRNLSGGVQQGNRVMDILHLAMTIDGEKAFHSEGTTVFVNLLNTNGGRINDLVGSNGGIDNIEAPTHAFKLYQAWVQQNFMEDKVSVLAGLHDLNTEFYVTDTSGLFINPTYGIGTEMAATGDNGPSIFPTTALGLRIAVQPTDATYIMAAGYNGVAGNPNNPRGTHFQRSNKDGVLLVGEAGVRDESIGHFAVGAWGYTAKRPDQVDTSLSRNSNGYYFLADKSVYKTDAEDISVFGRIGFAAGDVEQFKSNWSLGVLASGFVSSRPDGQIGLAVTTNTNSNKFRFVNTVDKSETQVELTYADKLLPWLTVQPDLQYTVNPGTDPSLDNAWTGGIRVSVDF